MDFYLKEKNMSIKDALAIAKPNDIIYLDNKIYNEKIEVHIPNLTVIGLESSVISYDAAHQTIIPLTLGGDGVKKFGTTGSATFRVCEDAVNFKAINVTFLNSYKREGRPNGQAVAFKSEASNTTLENCSIISHQDTLYMDFGVNNIIKNCYIEGDIDFIFGSANCKFINCRIRAVSDERKVGYFVAPDTFKRNKEGFIFKNCIFTADADMEIYLGRAWFPSGAQETLYPRLKLQGCELPLNTNMVLKQMHEGDPYKYTYTIKDCILK